jgi:Zn-finger protein
MKDKLENWEKEFDEMFKDGLWSDADSLAVHREEGVKDFISNLLKAQREEILEEFIGELDEVICKYERKE